MRRAAVGALVSLIGAVASGLVAAAGVGRLLRWLRLGTHYKEPARLSGTVATVVSPMREARVGEIVYHTSDGARASHPARSADGTPLSAGTEVIVVRVEDGIAQVAPATELYDHAGKERP